MEEFTQKWAVISLLKDASEGSSFYYTDFPLHVTLAGVFKIDKPGMRIVDEMQKVLSHQSPFIIEGDEQDMFGPNRDIPVMRIKKSSELLQLYTLVHDRLVTLGAIYNSPAYQGSGYIAHSTFQKSGKLAKGEKRQLSSVSIIDLLPNGDGYQRKIFKTIELS